MYKVEFKRYIERDGACLAWEEYKDDKLYLLEKMIDYVGFFFPQEYQDLEREWAMVINR